MRWVDGHLDLACLALEGRELRRPCPDPRLGSVSLPELRDAGVDVVLATIFTEPVDDDHDAHGCSYPADDAAAARAAGLRQLEIYERLEGEGEISIVRTRADLDDGGALPRVVLLMEGADPIAGPEDVAHWYERGLRVVGLTWSRGTRYAGGNAGGGPLSAAGADLVDALDAAGIAHDASHLSDEAFDGLLARAQGRIVATHSNCRALVAPNERLLRDDQITEIGARRGLVGLNLYTAFLAPSRRATIADCVTHVARVAELMGHGAGVALGSDADGGFTPESLPVDLDHPSKLPALAAALRAEGWSDDDVRAFAAGNWLRFLGEILP